MLVLALINDVPAQGRAIYDKTFPDGTRVSVTRRAITEFKTRPAAANPGVPAEELFADQEWRHVAYTASLKTAGGKEERPVWQEWVEYRVAPKYSIGSAELRVVDTLLGGDSFYVLYSDAAFYTVGGAQKNADGNWIRIPPLRLARQPDAWPIISAKVLDGNRPRIVLEYIGPDSKRLTWRWTLADGKWRRK